MVYTSSEPFTNSVTTIHRYIDLPKAEIPLYKLHFNTRYRLRLAGVESLVSEATFTYAMQRRHPTYTYPPKTL